MSTTRRTAKSIFLEAVENHQPDQWDAFLAGACGEDADLRLRAEDLLKAHRGSDSLLDAPAATVDLPAGEVEAGTMIGRYKLLQQIGEGGFGVVFMAEQQQPVKRKVALKVIKPGMDSKAVIARFEAERQALAMMDHTNIAKVLDGGTTEHGRPYFVMELVRGMPITEYCDKSQLPTRERLELFNTICRAVQHAHQKGIIHRDLSPKNVLVTMADGKPVVKVIDFGISKAINQQLTEKTLFTALGQMIGTPQYMSPEQAEMSCLDVDTRSDIYSLGVILYELLTGTTPIEAERLRTAGYVEMQRMIREEEPPKPSTRLSTSSDPITVAKHQNTSADRLQKLIAGDLDWIIMKALEKDRDRRYETATSFATDIERFLTDEPVEARPPSSINRVKKFLRRNRALASSVAAVFCALSIGLVLTWLQSAEKERALFDLRETLFDKGMSDSLAGNMEKTQIVVERLRSINGAENLATLLEAFHLLLQERHDDAIKLLEPVVDAKPADAAARGLLTNAYEGNGEFERSYQSHELLRDLEPDTAEGTFFQALGYSSIEPQTSVELFTKALAYRRSPVAYLYRGRALADWAMQSGQTDLFARSRADVERASSWLGTSGNTGIQLMRTHLSNMHAALASSDTTAYGRARDAGSEVAHKIEQEDIYSEWKDMFLGHYYSSVGEPALALERYEEATLNGNEAAVDFYLATAYEMDVRPEPRILQGGESTVMSDAGRATYWAAIGIREKAFELANRNIDRHPESTWAVFMAIDLYNWFGDFDAAAELGRNLNELVRGTGSTRRQRWDDLENLQQFIIDGDEQRLLKTARDHTYHRDRLASAYWTIAAPHIGRGNWPEAAACFARHVEQQIYYGPSHAWARAFLKRQPVIPSSEDSRNK